MDDGVIIVTFVASLILGMLIGASLCYPSGEQTYVEICMDEHPNYYQTITTFTTDFKKVR